MNATIRVSGCITRADGIPVGAQLAPTDGHARTGYGLRLHGQTSGEYKVTGCDRAADGIRVHRPIRLRGSSDDSKRRRGGSSGCRRVTDRPKNLGGGCAIGELDSTGH